MAKAKGWVIKGSKVNMSDKVASLYRDGPLDPVRVWLMLACSVDSWGMLDGNEWNLKAALGKKDKFHGPEDFAKAVDELVGARLVARWYIQGDPWLYVVGHDEEHKISHRSKYPEVERPPLEVLNEGGDLGDLRSILDRSEIDVTSIQDPDPPARAGSGSGKGKGKGRGEKPSPSPRKSDKSKNETDRSGHRDKPHSPPRRPQSRSVSSFDSESEHDSDRQPSRDGGPPPVVPGGGTGPEKVGDVVSSIFGPAQIANKRPTSETQIAIQELLFEYQQAWNLDAPPVMPEHDNLRRVVEALDHPSFGLDACRRAIRGHRKIAGKDGAQHGRDFRHVFPPAMIGGKRQPNRVDINRVEEYARAGGPPGKKKSDWIRIERDGKIFEINRETKEERTADV